MATETIYIAGPMRGYPRYNFAAFDEATEKWREWSWKVISPAEMDRNAGFDPDNIPAVTPEGMRECIRRDLLSIIKHCDAIALLPGWEQSAGVKVEKALAEFLGLEIYNATTGELIDSGDPCHNAAEPDLELGQVFDDSDPKITQKARELQAAGAKFEYKHDASRTPWGMPALEPYHLLFGVKSHRYRMVSPPPELDVNCSVSDDGTFAALGDSKPVVTSQKFSTGAVRSSDANGTRYDLISHIGLRRIAETYAEGAIKYDDNNWLKGFPASDVLNHCIKHIYQWLSGDSSEDHLAHAAWNLITVMHFEETRPELIDCYHRQERGSER